MWVCMSAIWAVNQGCINCQQFFAFCLFVTDVTAASLGVWGVVLILECMYDVLEVFPLVSWGACCMVHGGMMSRISLSFPTIPHWLVLGPYPKVLFILVYFSGFHCCGWGVDVIAIVIEPIMHQNHINYAPMSMPPCTWKAVSWLILIQTVLVLLWGLYQHGLPGRI